MSILAIGFAAMWATGIAAQSQTTKTTTETKTEIKDGKEITVTGCLERGADKDYVLSSIRQTRRPGGPSQYALVTNDDLSKDLGRLVEIRGKTVTRDHGTVSIESKTKVEAEDRPDQEVTTKTQGTSGAFDVPFLSVSSIKTRSSSCN